MLDVRKPMGLLFVILGALLFLYGLVFSQPIPFYTPNSWFPLKLNQPVGAFMFMFGALMLALARFVQVNTVDREMAMREAELNKAERKRQRALAKRELAGGGQVAETGGHVTETSESAIGGAESSADQSDPSARSEQASGSVDAADTAPDKDSDRDASQSGDPAKG